LRTELGGEFNSQSDTEVLLRAYERWGVQCLDKLVGMFAFAIWDHKKEALFIARDRLGIKPLYYNIQGKQLAFASEMRSLLASGFIEKSINPSGLYHYLSFGHCHAPLIDSARELQPGHYLWIDKNGDWEEKEYWNPFSQKEPSALPPHEEVKNIIEQAIACRRISDVPLGAFLSGGIDSSVVVGNLAKVSDDPVTTLTVGFAEKQFDESEFAQQIADRFKTQHHALRLSGEQPTMDGINTYLISRSAHEIGLKVVLSGLGGDELFGGYPSFKLIPKLRQAQVIPKALLKWAAGLNKSLFPSDASTKMEHWAQGKFSGAHEYFLIRALFCQDPVAKLFADPKLAATEIKKDYQRTQTLQSAKCDDLFNHISYMETFHYLQNMLLRDVDMMSMAHPVEIRVPFMDHRLVELMFRLPGKEKGSNKSLLVNSMKSLLPQSVGQRKKMGFTFPFEIWMRGALRGQIEPVLLSNMKQLDGLLDQRAVEEVWNDFLARKISWARPWALYVLKSWVNKNLS
jgi:asparagine synthase (glutamine-hydrolysing)